MQLENQDVKKKNSVRQGHGQGDHSNHVNAPFQRLIETAHLIFVMLRTLFPFSKISRTTLLDRPAFLVHTLRALCRHINILPLVRLNHIGQHVDSLNISFG